MLATSGYHKLAVDSDEGDLAAAVVFAVGRSGS
jgi:hypothetical protein